MKTLNILLIALLIGLTFSCSKDDDNITSGEGLVGAWEMTGIDYSGNTITEVLGIETIIDFTGTGYDMDLIINFSEDPNEYTQNGDYSIKLDLIINGQKTTQDWTNQMFVSNGTWSQNGNTISITDNIGDTQNALITELSNSKLVMKWDYTTVTEENGVKTTQKVKGKYSFKK